MTAARVSVALAAILVALSAACASRSPRAGSAQVTGRGAKPAIIAYLFPRNNLTVPSEIAADKLTHINYAFAGTGLYQPGTPPSEPIEARYGPVSAALVNRGGTSARTRWAA